MGVVVFGDSSSLLTLASLALSLVTGWPMISRGVPDPARNYSNVLHVHGSVPLSIRRAQALIDCVRRGLDIDLGQVKEIQNSFHCVADLPTPLVLTGSYSCDFTSFRRCSHTEGGPDLFVQLERSAGLPRSSQHTEHTIPALVLSHIPITSIDTFWRDCEVPL